MSTFCKFCGTKLEDGQECSCSKAVEERTAAAKALHVRQSVEEIQQSVQQVQQPVQVAAQQPIVQNASTEVHIPEPVAKAVNNLGAFIKSFFKNPIVAADGAENLPALTSFILLFMQVIAFVIFWAIYLRRTLGLEFEFNLHMGLPFIASLIGWAALYGAMFIVGIVINKGSINAKKLFTAISVGSLAWVPALLVSALISLILGDMAGGVNFICILLLVATNVISLFLIDRVLKKVFISDWARLVTLSVSASLQFLAGYLFLSSGVKDYMISLVSFLFQ